MKLLITLFLTGCATIPVRLEASQEEIHDIARILIVLVCILWAIVCMSAAVVHLIKTPEAKDESSESKEEK